MTNTILNKKQLLTETYFELQEHMESIYGIKTVVLMEIGSFYEVYEAKIGKAKEIAKTLNIAITKKNKSILTTDEKNPYLCGIPSISIDKYLQKLTEENWNIAIFKQKGTMPNIERYLERVITPGTKTDFISDEYNFIGSLILEKNSENVIYGGLSLIDVSIGKTLLYESYGTKEDVGYALDNFKNILNKYSVSELIFVSDFDVEFSENISIHKKTSKEIKKEENIAYQNELFKRVFNLESFLSPIEELDIELKPNASTSLSVLLTFILEHNYFLTENLLFPEFIDDGKYLYLGNNALEQLNIINSSVSLEKLINKGVSAIGRRYIKEQLLSPIRDLSIINDRFNKTLDFVDFETISIKNKLRKTYDIERIYRKIKTDNVFPSDLHNLYQTALEIYEINQLIKGLSAYKEFNFSILGITEFFDVERMQFLTLSNITENFIKKGYFPELDNLVMLIEKKKDEYLKIAMEIDSYTEFKQIGYSESEGYYVEISKRKFLEGNFKFDKKELKNSVKLYPFDDELVALETKMNGVIKQAFSDLVSKIDFSEIEELSLYIGYLDFYINNAELIKKWNYKIPEITEGDSFIDFKDIRHPIIERFEQNGIYITNDIVLGNSALHEAYNEIIMQGEDKVNGLMLYGLNSAGKTSLSKAIGIAIIMGQAGFPVAGNCRFSLFNNLFTRIKGEDDLEKGLSTFAVEMIEVKNILNRADSKTFVLGDEISHGTETTSGLSIVSSTVLELVEKGALFIFSTHLHQLRKIDEFNDCSSIKDVHLSVLYNEVEDELVYDRKLKSGSGSSLYGLEFAKFLKLPKSFLERAYKIRNKLAEDLEGVELLVQDKRRYNKSHIVTVCEICGEKADDVHHISEQHLAVDGYVGDVKLNHKFNLVNLCKQHHLDVHDGKLFIKGYSKTSKGMKLDYDFN